MVSQQPVYNMVTCSGGSEESHILSSPSHVGPHRLDG